jgi:hypothetical protein
MSKPTIIKFYPEHNEDEELTCLFCTLPKCEQRIEVRGGGQVRILGIHNDCADKHEDRQRPKMENGK